MKLKFSLLLIFFFSLRCLAQPYEREDAFADHLWENKLYGDAVLQFRRMRTLPVEGEQRNKLFYRLGYSYEQLGQTDSSLQAYAKVSLLHPQYLPAFSGSAQLLLKEKRYAEFAGLSDKFVAFDSSTAALRAYCRSAAALLNGDTAAFRLASPGLRFSTEELNPFVRRLQEQNARLLTMKKRSPFVAGALSALVPGLGKVYAGKPRHGIAAFFPIAIIGVQAFECYRKGGWKDPRFLAYGSLFTAFYLGNIYGSALSVRVQRRETIEDIHYVVQADLHIALERLRR